jgi:subtilase family serine protease
VFVVTSARLATNSKTYGGTDCKKCTGCKNSTGSVVSYLKISSVVVVVVVVTVIILLVIVAVAIVGVGF